MPFSPSGKENPGNVGTIIPAVSSACIDHEVAYSYSVLSSPARTDCDKAVPGHAVHPSAAVITLPRRRQNAPQPDKTEFKAGGGQVAGGAGGSANGGK